MAYRVSTGYVALLHTGLASIRVGSSFAEILHPGVAAIRVSSAYVEVLRSLSDQTAIVAESKLTTYMVGQASTDNKEQTSNLVTYVALERAPEMDASMLNAYAVMLSSPTSESKLTAYAVLELQEQASKLTGYAVLRLTEQASKLTGYAVLRAPFAMDKMTGYAVLDKLGTNREPVSKFTGYAVLRGQIKMSALTSYAIVNDPTPRYIYSPKLTGYTVLDRVLIRESKLTAYAVLEIVPRHTVDVPKSTVYAVVGNLNPQSYLSLSAADVLTGGNPNSRLSLGAVDVLTGGNPNSRLSRMVADVLTGGDPLSRLSYMVAEILISVPREPYMIDPATHLFPTLSGLAFNVKKKPNFSTVKQVNTSGRNVRMAFYDMPLWDFELTYEFLLDGVAGKEDLQTLAGFFLQRQGSYDAFLFLDPDDYVSTNTLLGTADGTTTNYWLRRSFGGFNEIIGQLNQDEPLVVTLKNTNGETHTVPASAPYTIVVNHAGTFSTDYGVTLVAGGSPLTKTSSSSPAAGQYYVDASSGTYKFNVAQAGAAVKIIYSWTADEGTDFTVAMPNEIVFGTAPASGIEIYASFQFYFVCYFSEDAAEFEKFADKLWELQKIDFQSILG